MYTNLHLCLNWSLWWMKTSLGDLIMWDRGKEYIRICLTILYLQCVSAGVMVRFAFCCYSCSTSVVRQLLGNLNSALARNYDCDNNELLQYIYSLLLLHAHIQRNSQLRRSARYSLQYLQLLFCTTPREWRKELYFDATIRLEDTWSKISYISAKWNA